MLKKDLIFIAMVSLILIVLPLFAQGESQMPNKISLDLKNMDIIDVLKILSMQSGMNIVAGRNVTGRVTIFLKDVDPWDAFEIILAANDLAYERRGEIINVMTERNYEMKYGERYHDKKEVKIIPLKYVKAVDLSQALNQVKTNIGRVVVDDISNTLVVMDVPERITQIEKMISEMDRPTRTRVYTLHYAKVSDLKPKIEEALTKGIGNVKIDERMNKVAITDFPDNLERISSIIYAFDEKTPEVLIDSKIVEVLLADDTSTGVDWDMLFSGVDATISGNFDIISSGSLGGSFTVGVLSERGYSVMMEALQTIAKTRHLSNPRIAVLNNEEAKILIGTKEAYVTTTTTQSDGTATTAESVTFVDVGVNLSVKPTINPDGFVTMKIKPEVSSVDRTLTTASKNVIPIVRTSEAETTVTVKDGRTIVIAGLIEDKTIDTVNKVPLLGDIPLLGRLFRSNKVEVDRTELAIFLTPRIISGDVEYLKSSFFSDEAKKVLDSLELAEVPIAERNQIYANYCRVISERISNFAKSYFTSAAPGKVELSFVLLANGQLKEEPKVKLIKGEDKSLLEAALKSVEAAEPFPPFPKILDQPEEEFNISISFE
jgi:type II secretory pathway component GspD/PulD (secretin)